MRGSQWSSDNHPMQKALARHGHGSSLRSDENHERKDCLNMCSYVGGEIQNDSRKNPFFPLQICHVS